MSVTPIISKFVNPGVVQCLEKALEEARAGRLTGVTVSGEMTDASVYSDYAGKLTAALIGEASEQLHCLIKTRIESR